jgi:hypothetical protein
MKVLLDECVPQQVRKSLPGHFVFTMREMGWRGYKNGRLLAAVEKEAFDLLIVADKNLRYQQNLLPYRFAILELWTNHRPTLEKHFARIAKAVNQIKPGDYLVLSETSP